MDIIIDTEGQIDAIEDISSSEEEECESETDEEVPENFSIPYRTSMTEKGHGGKSKDADIDIHEDTYLVIHVGIGKQSRPTDITKRPTTRIEEILKKSVITQGFEKLESIPLYEESKRKMIKQRREERAKNKGEDWFNLPAPDMTDELKHDLEVLRMRSVLDPKQFYKKNDFKVLPKYFQVGRIVEAPADFYHSRIPKKQRKKTIVEELLADADFKRYNKRKYKEIIADKKIKGHLKAHKHSKKLKKKKK